MKKDDEIAHVTAYLPLTDIRADHSFNCRGQITMPSIIELANNIKTQGLLQPVVVGPVGADGKRLLVAGYRRYEAHQYLKADKIFCVIRDDLTDHHTLLLMNFQENLQRVNLDMIQEGQTIQRLRDEGIPAAKIHKLLNRTESWVDTRLQAIQLPKDVQKEILAGVFTAKHVKQLYNSFTSKKLEDFYDDARWLKEQRQSGKKNVTLATREAEQRKEFGARQRTRAEIYKMQKVMADSFGQDSLPPKILGWVNGHVTGLQLEDSIQDAISTQTM